MTPTQHQPITVVPRQAPSTTTGPTLETLTAYAEMCQEKFTGPQAKLMAIILRSNRGISRGNLFTRMRSEGIYDQEASSALDSLLRRKLVVEMLEKTSEGRPTSSYLFTDHGLAIAIATLSNVTLVDFQVSKPKGHNELAEILELHEFSTPRAALR